MWRDLLFGLFIYVSCGEEHRIVYCKHHLYVEQKVTKCAYEASLSIIDFHILYKHFFALQVSESVYLYDLFVQANWITGK